MKIPFLIRQAAREPLLHFLVLGLAVFAADRALNGSADARQIISVDAVVQKESRAIFEAGLKRPPSPADMKILLERWVDNEVLYREGLALGLDRGDSAIRERVIFKALSVAQTGSTLPKIDEAGLRAWFEARHDRYDAPARFDFLEAVVVGDSTPGVLQSFVAALNGRGQSDSQSDLRVFKDRPRPNLVETYGADFTGALEQLAPGRWQALPSREGLRVVRLESAKPGRVARFEDMKSVVFQDWKDDTMAALTTQAVREMGKKYVVQIEGERR